MDEFSIRNNEAWMTKARAGLKYASDRLANTKLPERLHLLRADILPDALTGKPSELSFACGTKISFAHLGPDWIEATKVEEISREFTRIVREAISQGKLPPAPNDESSYGRP